MSVLFLFSSVDRCCFVSAFQSMSNILRLFYDYQKVPQKGFKPCNTVYISVTIFAFIRRRIGKPIKEMQCPNSMEEQRGWDCFKRMWHTLGDGRRFLWPNFRTDLSLLKKVLAELFQDLEDKLKHSALHLVLSVPFLKDYEISPSGEASDGDEVHSTIRPAIHCIAK